MQWCHRSIDDTTQCPSLAHTSWHSNQHMGVQHSSADSLFLLLIPEWEPPQTHICGTACIVPRWMQLHLHQIHRHASQVHILSIISGNISNIASCREGCNDKIMHRPCVNLCEIVTIAPCREGDKHKIIRRAWLQLDENTIITYKQRAFPRKHNNLSDF